MRGPLKSNVESPKVLPLARLPFGTPKFGWLKMLKKLAWNCSFQRSVNLKFLATPKSVFTNPGARKVFLPVGLSHQRPKFVVAGHVAATKLGFTPVPDSVGLSHPPAALPLLTEGPP